MLDARTLAVLGMALRTRNTDPARLAALLSMDPDTVGAELAELERHGHLGRTEEGLNPLIPLDTFVKEASATLADQAWALQALAYHVEALPGLVRDWEIGHPDADLGFHAELIHSPFAIMEAWWRYCDSTQTADAIGMKPNPSGFGMAPWEGIERFAEQASRSSIRMLVGSDPLDDATRDALTHLAAHGMQIRTHPTVPSAGFATSDGIAGLPTQWGDDWPSTVLLVRNAPVAASLWTLFESLWAKATPFGRETPEWEPILRLKSQGLTDEEIADRLNWSTRTVRRRINDAMDDLGVTDRFTLGEAWARRTS